MNASKKENRCFVSAEACNIVTSFLGSSQVCLFVEDDIRFLGKNDSKDMSVNFVPVSKMYKKITQIKSTTCEIV